MALMKKTQRSFSGGMLDKDLAGRQDLAKYSQGCLVLENFKVRKQGNVIKRSGTDLVCDFTNIKGSAGAIGSAKLVPLVQEREQGLYILLTGGRAYLVSPEGVRMNDGTWSRSPAHADSPSTLAPYSIAVPFSDADLERLDWCQSGDTIFTAHRMYPPGKIFYSNGELEYEQIRFRQGSGTPPQIASVELLGDKWTGTGGLVHLEYAVTAVKDGVETGMSVPFATEYNAPWDASSSILITIDTSSLPADSWDYFNVYKKEADVFGLIGTTSGQRAFVDVNDGSQTITYGLGEGYGLCPFADAGMNMATHFREDYSADKFATCWHAVYWWKATISWGFRDATQAEVTAFFGSSPTYLTNPNAFIAQLEEADNATYDWRQTEERNSPSTAVKSTSVAYAVTGKAMSSFRVGLGCLLHDIKSEQVEIYSRTIPTINAGGVQYCPQGGSWPASSIQTTLLSTTTQYKGLSTSFIPSAAKYYTATVTLRGTGSWASYTTTVQVAATAAADQSSVGDYYALDAETGRYVHEYSQEEYMLSSDPDTLLVRMGAHAPSVAAAVWFELPDEITSITVNGEHPKVADFLVTGISIAGYADEGRTTAAEMVVNGVACYRDGKYVGTFTDSYITPDLTITPPKTEDHFVNPGEYPGCVQLYSQRLVYAASAKEPFTFWMSATGDLYNFDVHEYVRASDSIKASTAALEMPRINRMLVHRDLMLFAEGGEWQVAPATGNAVAPSTIAAKLQSTIGCAAWLKPMPIESDIIFCDSSGETLMATRYNFASDGYESSNLSVLSQRLFRNNPIRAMAYVQFPESTIECVLADGTVASLVYMREHDVCAWSLHRLGGGWQARDVAANKSVAAGSSHCAFLASRQYNAGTAESPSITTKWAILALRDIDPNDETLAGNLRMDAVRTATTTRAAGATEPTQPAVADGEMAVRVGEVRETDSTDPEHPVTIVTGDVWAVGCPFRSVIKTTSPEFTDKETAQMEVKNATESEIRVIDGSDFTVRQPEVPPQKATRMKVPSPVDETKANFTVELGDADRRMPLVGTNATNGSIVLEHDGYLPLAVLSVSTSYRVEFANNPGADRNGGEL